MRHSLILGTALCFMATASHAGGNHETPAPAPKPAAPSYTGTNNNAALAGAAAQSRSAAASASHATSNAAGGRANSSTGPVTVNNTNSGGGYGGGYSARAPDVILGSVSGGNPCGLGAGAGGAVQNVGAAFQKMWEGEGCQTNEDAKLLYNIGLNAVAKARLCESTWYSNAFAQAGQPCPADVARWWAAGYRPDPRGGWTK